MDGRTILVYDGTVQGVGFRWRARRLALRHRLAGRVRNEADGSVTVEVEGPADARAAWRADLAESQAELGLPFRESAREAPPAGYGDFVVLDD